MGSWPPEGPRFFGSMFRRHCSPTRICCHLWLTRRAVLLSKQPRSCHSCSNLPVAPYPINTGPCHGSHVHLPARPTAPASPAPSLPAPCCPGKRTVSPKEWQGFAVHTRKQLRTLHACVHRGAPAVYVLSYRDE